jgi:MoxR-like ATPase
VAKQDIERLRTNIRGVYLGQARSVDLLLTGLLARGHVLIEDVPGVGKTVLARSLAKSIDCKFTRIQLTPDLLPGDVLGVSVYNSNSQQFDFKPGPIFANIVLADEINRTTPRTQSALLEAMSEEQVSDLQRLVRRLPAPPSIVSYAVQLARSTRPTEPDASADVKRYVSYGAGPRASQYLVLGAKARAAMDGRPIPDLDDVRSVALSVLRHRVVLNFQAEAEGVGVERLLSLNGGGDRR